MRCLVLRDVEPKPLVLQEGAVESYPQHRNMLIAATQKLYYSLDTSPSACACALHGAFGWTCDSGAVFYQMLAKWVVKSCRKSRRRTILSTRTCAKDLRV